MDHQKVIRICVTTSLLSFVVTLFAGLCLLLSILETKNLSFPDAVKEQQMLLFRITEQAERCSQTVQHGDFLSIHYSVTEYSSGTQVYSNKDTGSADLPTTKYYGWMSVLVGMCIGEEREIFVSSAVYLMAPYLNITLSKQLTWPLVITVQVVDLNHSQLNPRLQSWRAAYLL